MRNEFLLNLNNRLSNIIGEYVDILSCDIHRQVGGYPGKNHQMPTCCKVMHDTMVGNDEVLIRSLNSTHLWR